MGNPFGRSTTVPLTNKSGASVANGDFVYVGDGSNADAFTTGTTANRTSAVGIAQQTIANGAVGLVTIGGYVSLVNVNASVTLNHFGASYSVAKQATDVGATRASGTCLFYLTAGATPDAILWQPDLGGASLTNPMTTTGDIIYSSDNSGTPARLGAGTLGYPFVGTGAGTIPAYAIAAKAHYCAVYSAATTTLSTGTNSVIVMASEIADTDTYHFTSAAALTGTVTKTATSAAIVGSSTLFTSELSVNQVISIPGTAAEIGVVKLITDNTHLTLWQTMANSASGQTATRKNEYIAIPAGLGGIYLIRCGGIYACTTVSGANAIEVADIFVNGVLIWRDSKANIGANSNNYLAAVSEPYLLNAGDYVHMQAFQNLGANVTFGSTGTPDQGCGRLSVVLLGTT